LTNATKAGVITAINTGLGLAIAFGIPLSEAQFGALIAFANSVLGLVVLLTYKDSPKRIPDA
jgi:hypothetical protein